MKVCILDYGSGNVQSVFRAFRNITQEVIISNNEIDIHSASHLVLPGVGSFPAAMRQINKKINTLLIKSLIESGVPFLGICVGMQVMATKGFEFEETHGLNLIPNSTVNKINSNLRTPHVGWNNVKLRKKSRLIEGIEDDSDFYFVHSYCFEKLETNYIIGTTEYGYSFPTVVEFKNSFGVQFHPEKSQRNGMKILRNFISLGKEI